LCLVIVEDLWELYSKHNSSLTAHEKDIFIKDPSWYFILAWVVDRLSIMPPAAVDGEAVTAIIEVGGRKTIGGRDIIAGVDRGACLVIGVYTMTRNVGGSQRGGGGGRKESGHR
jgi:hypothetical protein